MKQSIISQLEVRKEELLEKQKEYNFDYEDREIKKKEDEINELISRKNNKKSMSDIYQRDIDRIDITIKNIDDIIEDEKVEEPEGEENNDI